MVGLGVFVIVLVSEELGGGACRFRFPNPHPASTKTSDTNIKKRNSFCHFHSITRTAKGVRSCSVFYSINAIITTAGVKRSFPPDIVYHKDDIQFHN